MCDEARDGRQKPWEQRLKYREDLMMLEMLWNISRERHQEKQEATEMPSVKAVKLEGWGRQVNWNSRAMDTLHGSEGFAICPTEFQEVHSSLLHHIPHFRIGRSSCHCASGFMYVIWICMCLCVYMMWYMYVCVDICSSVCVYAYSCICVNVWHMCMYLCACVHICKFMHIWHMYVWYICVCGLCICVYICVCMFMCVACICVSVGYVFMCVVVFVHVCGMCEYTSICVYLCVCGVCVKTTLYFLYLIGCYS